MDGTCPGSRNQKPPAKGAFAVWGSRALEHPPDLPRGDASVMDQLTPNDDAAACFRQYGLPTDSTGRYAAMYKTFHLIGLELGISVLNVALRNEPTGRVRGFRGDAVAVAK